jgi:sugar O-acyltransferase (sialic acid O-acetyltransferase NeuD family)
VLDKKIVLVGYSGHSYVVADSLMEKKFSISHYTEKSAVNFNPFKLNFLGNESSDTFLGWGKNYVFALCIGDNKLRTKSGELILLKKEELINVLDINSNISTFLEIGKGNFIAKNVSINAFCKIGNFCIINTGSIIEHECQLSDGVHIAPGTVLAGNVKVGKNSFIGANSVIKQGVNIGENVIVGAGTVVLKDIEDNSIVVGNPGRKIVK